jgi:hypothetical protein
MKGINVARWLLGGLVAGIIIWVIEGAVGLVCMREIRPALEAHGLSTQMGAGVVVLGIIASLIIGLTMVFFYAAARPRFGPGPRTAGLVAVVLWVGAYVVSLMGYEMLGLFPARMLVLWGTVGLGEMILASIVGACIYRETP